MNNSFVSGGIDSLLELIILSHSLIMPLYEFLPIQLRIFECFLEIRNHDFACVILFIFCIFAPLIEAILNVFDNLPEVGLC